MAVCTALFTATFREPIALLYNDSPAVVAMASQLMLLAALYQISDSIQVIGSGVLRGYKDTRAIFFITFIAYWVLGLPSGYLLALTDGSAGNGAKRFLDRLYHRPDLRRHHDGAAHALAAETADRRHPAAIHALSPRPAGFIPGRAAVCAGLRTTSAIA